MSTLTRDGTLVLTYNPGPTPLHIRTSRDEGLTWSEPTLLADRPTKVGGWSIFYPTLTELPDGTLAAIWAQIKSSTGELYGDIHAARIKLKDGAASNVLPSGGLIVRSIRVNEDAFINAVANYRYGNSALSTFCLTPFERVGFRISW